MDRDPVDVTDADDAAVAARLPAAGSAGSGRARAGGGAGAGGGRPAPLLLRGDAAVVAVADAVARVPRGRPARRHHDLGAVSGVRHGAPPALPTTAFAEAAAGRAVAWVSAEGVGVAPTVPTLGDRPASGHSIIGLALFGRPAKPAEAIGRCWSRGRFLTWLADS